MAMDPALRRLALRTLLASFPSVEPPGWTLDLLADGLAGYTLFGHHITHPEQVAATTATLRAARPDVLVAIDEEGGDVTRLAHTTGSPYPGNAALGAVGDVSLTYRVYAAIGAELAALGVNVNLAPVVDVNSADDNPIIGTRSFGTDPSRVAAHSAAAVAGLQAAGVAACAKHFPGHGATVADSHHELPTVNVPLDTLRTRDLPPFVSVVAAGARAIMSGHIRVPALTGAGPATFSRAALVDLLRGELGFTGAVITDALGMRGATTAAGGIGRAAVLALAAGADLLCLGRRVDAALIEEVVGDIGAALREGRLDGARLQQAAAHADALAGWARRAVPHRSTTAAVRSGPHQTTPTDLGYAAARRAVRVEGSPAGLANPLVVQLGSSSTLVEGRVPWGLGPHLTGIDQVRVAAPETDAAALRQLAGGRPIVLVARHAYRLPGARELIGSLAASHPVVLVEMGWPAPWRPAGVRAVVITYGASHANGRAAAEVLGLTG